MGARQQSSRLKLPELPLTWNNVGSSEMKPLGDTSVEH